MKNTTNLELIKQLIQKGVIKSKQVIWAMERTDRKYYAPNLPYVDSPQSIGYGATISAPHMHGYALQYINKHLLTAKKVLDVGSGTGYLCTAMALMAPKEAIIYGIEHVPQLVDRSIENIGCDHPEMLKDGKIIIKLGDGRKGWIWDNIKFDVIHVGAAPKQIPEALTNQLEQGGRMVIPVGNYHQQFIALDKIEGKLKKTNLLQVRYVPLTDLNFQLQNQ